MAQEDAASVQDLVTQLQGQINRVGELFFGTVGELQRDAHPVSVSGEPIILEPSTSYNAQERANGFATELMQATKNIQALAEKIPDLSCSEAEQLARIQTLQQQSAELSRQIEEEKTVAEVKLQQAQQLYAALAEHALKQRAKS